MKNLKICLLLWRDFCENSVKRAVDLIKVICKEEIIVASSFEVVETAKVIENLQRDINIAMVNEFERFTKAMNLDIFEVIKVANTHKRVNLLYPGPGLEDFASLMHFII